MRIFQLLIPLYDRSVCSTEFIGMNCDTSVTKVTSHGLVQFLVGARICLSAITSRPAMEVTQHLTQRVDTRRSFPMNKAVIS
jgi:hypothetical protein